MGIGVLSWGGVRTAGVIACGLMVLAAAGAARGDIIIPDPAGTKRVPGTIQLDWGVFEARVSRRHVVVKGETLRKLATRYYDDVERWKEIAEENREALPDPNVVPIGAEVWIPPRTSPTKDFVGDGDEPDGDHTRLAPRYVAFWTKGYRRWKYRVSERASPGELPEAYRSGARLLLLEPKGAKIVLAALAKGERAVPDASWGTPIVAGLHPDTLVSADDPSVRVVSFFRLSNLTQQLVRTEVVRKRYGADGKRVAELFEMPGHSFPHSEAQPEAEPDDADDADDDATRADEIEGDDGVIRTSRDVAPSDRFPERWPTPIGVMVALLGLVIVAGVGYALRGGRRGDS
jgi:hypothetical protein